jgi:hypothetical protein
MVHSGRRSTLPVSARTLIHLLPQGRVCDVWRRSLRGTRLVERQYQASGIMASECFIALITRVLILKIRENRRTGGTSMTGGQSLSNEGGLRSDGDGASRLSVARLELDYLCTASCSSAYAFLFPRTTASSGEVLICVHQNFAAFQKSLFSFKRAWERWGQ